MLDHRHIYKTSGSFLSVQSNFLAQMIARRLEAGPCDLTKYITSIYVVFPSYRCSWGNILQLFSLCIIHLPQIWMSLNIPTWTMVQKQSCCVKFKSIYYVKSVIRYLIIIPCVYSDVSVTPLNLLPIIYYSGIRSFIKSWINLQGEECLIKNTIMCSSSGNKFDERFAESHSKG